ncbi:MAG TPA: FMN-binding negative transcriptional regulator [Noviherbaspirillum sp.]|jgi:transcriptional regulator|uniref:FMN-binding negative transcriptional regulator n=1 Tax=Noviherbaspirillum sp. TaxID=1926288 RepID=UPI002DDCBFD5|nr:FMN-binding negative transcriptional regulator [Noviherbaspirillum sp.]HEV2608876.1 FMN-binding negative transcriptional regulator [Noviherbaspirillum sp.]
MYVQKIFEETRTDVLHALMSDHPMASLVVQVDGRLEANNVPFEIDRATGPLGTLRCHVARASGFWRTHSPHVEAMVIFQGPNAYISPRWYVNGQKSGKVLPGWNYAVVHAYGRLRVMDDEQWLMAHLANLALPNEAAREKPWRLDEAPVDFVRAAATHIIGLEMTISELVGKWHVSQHRTPADRESVVAALMEEKKPGAAGIARLIAQVGK